MPDNAAYYQAAYALAAGIYAAYGASLWWRIRSMRQALRADELSGVAGPGASDGARDPAAGQVRSGAASSV